MRKRVNHLVTIGKKRTALVVLVLVALASTVAATTYFVLNKPASIQILANTYAIELYKEEIMPTTVVDSITFPSLTANGPINVSRSNTMYLFATETPERYKLTWTCDDLPYGCSLKAVAANDYEWNENQEIHAALVLPDSGNSGMLLYFELTTNGADVGNYNFNIKIFVLGTVTST